jgi:hypothetical protein
MANYLSIIKWAKRDNLTTARATTASTNTQNAASQLSPVFHNGLKSQTKTPAFFRQGLPIFHHIIHFFILIYPLTACTKKKPLSLSVWFFFWALWTKLVVGRGGDMTRSGRRARWGGSSVKLRDVKIDLSRGKTWQDDKRKRDQKRLWNKKG